MRALDMRALCLIGVGLVCSVASVAEAESPSAPRPHAAKKSTLVASVSKSASVGGNGFSDRYESTGNAWKAMSAQFSPVHTDPPVVPQGGFSLTAGRDSPDAPFTGGLKLRF